MSQVTVTHPSYRNLPQNKKLKKKQSNPKKHHKKKKSNRRIKRKITNLPLLPIKHRLIN
jgi:hypothetical protein